MVFRLTQKATYLAFEDAYLAVILRRTGQAPDANTLH